MTRSTFFVALSVAAYAGGVLSACSETPSPGGNAGEDLLSVDSLLVRGAASLMGIECFAALDDDSKTTRIPTLCDAGWCVRWDPEPNVEEQCPADCYPMK